MARTGNLEKGGNKAYITINDNLPDSSGNFEITSESLGVLPSGNIPSYITSAEDIISKMDTINPSIIVYPRTYIDGITTNDYVELIFPSSVNGSLEVKLLSSWQKRKLLDEILVKFFIDTTNGVKLCDVVGSYEGLAGYGYTCTKNPDNTTTLRIGMVGADKNTKNVYILRAEYNTQYSLMNKEMYTIEVIKNTDVIFQPNIYKQDMCFGKDINGYVINSDLLKVEDGLYLKSGIVYKYLGTTETTLPSTKVELIEGEWEKVGVIDTDLSNYATLTQLSLKQDKLPNEQLDNIANVPNLLEKGEGIPEDITALDLYNSIEGITKAITKTNFISSWRLGIISAADGALVSSTSRAYSEKIENVLSIKLPTGWQASFRYYKNDILVGTSLVWHTPNDTGELIISEVPKWIPSPNLVITIDNLDYDSLIIMVSKPDSSNITSEELTLLSNELEVRTLGINGAYPDTSSWKGKIWYAYGTSLTSISQGKYVSPLVELSGLEVVNKGIPGGGITKTSGGAIKNAIMNTTDGKLNADLITLEIGANDVVEENEIGTEFDEDDSTYGGCLNQCIQYLQMNTEAQILVMFSGPSTTTSPFSEKGQRYYKLMELTEKCCRVNRTHYLPSTSGLSWGRMCQDDNKKYIVDNIHNTDLGGRVWADFIWSVLKNIPPWQHT